MEPCHSGLIVQIAHKTIPLDRSWGRFAQLWRVVFGVLVVAHADKFIVVVAAGQNDGCNAENVFGIYLALVWRLCFEFKRVDANGNRAN